MTIYHTAKDRTPYTYLIGWSQLNKWYYGVRYAKGCHPDDLWVKYFTSSKYVKQFIKDHGDPDIIQVRKTFSSIISARLWEEKVLHKISAKDSNYWINKSNSNKTFYCLRTDPLSDAHKIKISKAHLGISTQHRQETKIKIGDTLRGKNKSDSHKKQLSLAAKGKAKSTEHKNNISISSRGNTNKRDKTIYKIENKEIGLVYIGQRADFSKIYGIRSDRLMAYSLKNKPYKGWVIIKY